MPKHRICIAFSEINTHQGNDRETDKYTYYIHIHMHIPFSRDGMIYLSNGCLLLNLMTYDLILLNLIASNFPTCCRTLFTTWVNVNLPSYSVLTFANFKSLTYSKKKKIIKKHIYCSLKMENRRKLALFTKKLLDFYILVKCSIVIHVVSYIIKIDAIVLYTI